jgi:RNA ligase (TIGR02306 family)
MVGEWRHIKRYPNIFEPGEQVIATEKAHGTCCCMTYVRSTDAVLVSSKGLAFPAPRTGRGRGQPLLARCPRHGVDELARNLSELLDLERVGIFGEVFGAGVQDLRYGHDARSDLPGYMVFDIKRRAAQRRGALAAPGRGRGVAA